MLVLYIFLKQVFFQPSQKNGQDCLTNTGKENDNFHFQLYLLRYLLQNFACKQFGHYIKSVETVRFQCDLYKFCFRALDLKYLIQCS